MNNNHFRREALEAYGRRWLGDVVISQPRLARVYVVLACVTIIALVAMVSLGEYRAHETAKGYIAGEASLYQVTAPIDGVVERLSVEEGSVVGARAPLVVVAGERPSVTGQLTAGDQREKLLRSRITLLTQSRDLVLAKMTQSREELLNRLRHETAQRDALQDRLPTMYKMASGAATVADQYESLMRTGFISLLQFEEKTRAALDANNVYLDLVHRKDELEQNISETQHRLAGLPGQELDEKIAVSARMLDLQDNLVSLESTSRREVSSTIRGVVEGVAVRPGVEVKAGQVLLVMRPQGAQPQAQLAVSSAAAALLEVGARVQVQLASFPQRRFGTVMGTIAALSRIPVASQDGTDPFATRYAPIGSYEVRVLLDASEVTDRGRRIYLRPGTEVSVELPLERVPLYRLIFRVNGGN